MSEGDRGSSQGIREPECPVLVSGIMSNLLESCLVKWSSERLRDSKCSVCA